MLCEHKEQQGPHTGEGWEEGGCVWRARELARQSEKIRRAGERERNKQVVPPPHGQNQNTRCSLEKNRGNLQNGACCAASQDHHLRTSPGRDTKQVQAQGGGRGEGGVGVARAVKLVCMGCAPKEECNQGMMSCVFPSKGRCAAVPGRAVSAS